MLLQDLSLLHPWIIGKNGIELSCNETEVAERVNQVITVLSQLTGQVFT